MYYYYYYYCRKNRELKYRKKKSKFLMWFINGRSSKRKVRIHRKNIYIYESAVVNIFSSIVLSVSRDATYLVHSSKV